MSGNESINRVVTDYELERGEHPIGKLVHISTVTHAWRGVLEAVTPSYYVLSAEQPVALVDETGAMGSYLTDPKGGNDSDVYVPPKKSGARATVRVLRSAVSWLVSW